MPKIIDYGGRFAFFELACFALVRDQGVDALSRHGIARTLGTSISTVRRLLSPHADLRRLALGEVGVRRRSRLRRPAADAPPVEAAVALLRSVVPLDADHVAEELVWWRIAVAAPTTAVLPPEHDHEDGPLPHRFSVATYGYVSSEALEAGVSAPRDPTGPDGEPDCGVAARAERHLDARARGAEAVHRVAPSLDSATLEARARGLHALVDGLGLGISLGLVHAAEGAEVLREHLALVAGAAARGGPGAAN